MKTSGLEPEEFAEVAARFLHKLIPHLPKSEVNKFIEIQTRTVVNLAHDILVLEDRKRELSASILIRSLCESLYSLLAACKNPKFVPAKLIYEDLKEAGSIEKRAEYEDAATKMLSIRRADSIKRTAEKHRKLHPHVNEKEWKKLDVKECAIKADLLDHYREEYSHFCNFSHGTLRGSVFLGIGAGFGHRMSVLTDILKRVSDALLPKVTPTEQAALRQEYQSIRECSTAVAIKLLMLLAEDSKKAEKLRLKSKSPSD